MPAAVPIIVAVVAAVASSIIQDKISGTSKNIKKQAKLAQEREALAEQARILQLNRDKAQAAKGARAKIATAANSQAAQGVLLSSSAIGAQTAVASNLRGALEFADATGALAAQDSALSQEQIRLEAKMKLPNHLSAGVGAGFSAVGSGAGQAAGSGIASMFSSSDRRLKKDIEFVYTRPDGLNVYEFEYVWGGKRRLGLMADEVAEVYPIAVAFSENGFGMVAYDLIPNNSNLNIEIG